MNKLILMLALLCGAVTAGAQNVKYERSLQEAERRSAESGKPLCIIVTMAPPPGITNVLGGLSVPTVADKFNEYFINFRIDRADSASAPIIKKYQLNGFPVFVFVDSKGGLLFKRVGNLPTPLLHSMLDMAVNASKQKSLAEYDQEYASGMNSAAFLKEYMTKRIKAGITDNADLIEMYVGQLTVKQLTEPGEILFILKAGPLADGKAYAQVYAGQKKRVDSLFMLESFEARAAINNRIIDNTMKSAIAAKNQLRAMAATNVIRSSWAPDYRTGSKNADQRMLGYYRSIGDTTRYLRQALIFYDQHYMRISVDSIRELERKAQESVRSRAQEQAELARPAGATISSVSYVLPVSNFSRELNNAAYTLYQTGTRNANYLTKAMLWSRRSIELNPSPAFYDTLAHLLYRLGFYAEAEATQVNAIQAAKKEKTEVKELERELEKIRGKRL